MATRRSGHSDSSVRDEDFLNIKRIRELPHGRDRLLLWILAQTGCTLSELIAIRTRDIRAHSIVVKGREIAIPAQLSAEIGEYIRGRPSPAFLFPSRQSGQIDARRAQQIVRKFLGTKPSAVRHARIAQIAKNEGVEEAKRASGLKVLREKKILSAVGEKKIRAQGDARQILILDVLIGTGCSLAELSRFRVGDVRRGVLSHKGGSVRVPPTITDGRNATEALLVSRQGGALTDKRVFQLLKELGDKTGVALNPRILKNTWIARKRAIGEKTSLKSDDFCWQGVVRDA